jgi:TQXA domain-containing protein/LPXTG-motif cell wall-anchored protein
VHKLRVGAALVGVAATALLASAIPAGAEPVKADGKVNVRADIHGLTVNLGQDRFPRMLTSLLGLDAGGKTLLTYCVELDTAIDRGNHPGMDEVDWDKYPKAGSPFRENNKKINWVLHNGYPTVGTDALGKAMNATFKDGLSEKEAISATQAAVWHFSDKANLDRGNPTPDNKDSKDDVLAVYDYLIGKAQPMEQPQTPELSVSPKSLTGAAGKLIGPFTISTTIEGVTIAADLPTGVTLTDKDGKDLPKAEVARKIQQLDKYDFFVKVPADAKAGKADFTVGGDSHLLLGRLFVSKDAKKPTQSLIVAKDETVKLKAQGTATWKAAGTPATESTTETTTTSTTPAPAPQASNGGDLASTGASVLTPIIIGVGLVGAGAGALVFQRRRKRA